MKIYISPEVLTWKTYAWGDTNEHEQMTKLAQKLKTAYEAYGGKLRIAEKTLTTTTKNTTVNGRLVSGRMADAIHWGADVFVALHSNARGKTSNPAKGAVLFYKNGEDEARKICLDVYASLSAIMPHNSPHGDVRPHNTFYEVQEPSVHGMKAVYIEVEFHDQADNAEWIVKNLDLIAEAIASGFAKYEGLTKGSDSSAGGGGSTIKLYPFDNPYRAEQAIQGYEKPLWQGQLRAIKRKGDPIRSVERADRGDSAFVRCADTDGWYLVKADGRWQVSDARPKTHTVEGGDTLWSIASKYLGDGMRYPEIVEVNRLKTPVILVGQVLELPKK